MEKGAHILERLATSKAVTDVGKVKEDLSRQTNLPRDSRASLIDYALIVIGSRIFCLCCPVYREYIHHGLWFYDQREYSIYQGIYISVLVNRRYFSLLNTSLRPF